MTAGMSCPVNGRQLVRVGGNNFRERLSMVLRDMRRPAKELERAVGKTPKAAERWLSGDNTMSAETLVQLMSDFDDVWEFVCREAGRDQATAAETLDRLEALLKERRRGAP